VYKGKTILLKLPTLNRKWDRIDLNRILKSDKGVIFIISFIERKQINK
jgi:hypothetical protein